jgi:hypothetical protein
MSSLTSQQHLQRVAVLRAVHSILAGSEFQTSMSPSRDIANFSLEVLLHLADAALQSTNEATQLRCIRVLLLEAPNHELEVESSLRMCHALRALSNRADAFPTVQQAVKLLFAVLVPCSSLPADRAPLLPPRIPAPTITNQRFMLGSGIRIFQGSPWESLRVCNSAFMIDISTVPYSTLGYAFDSLHSSTVRTIEDDPEFGGHLLQQLPEDSELIEVERKWLHIASLVNAQPCARDESYPRPVSPNHTFQELLLPEGLLVKLMACLTTSNSESETFLKASSIMARVLADRCVFDKAHGVSAVSACLHEIMVSSFFSAKCCFTLLYNVAAYLVIMDCNSVQLSEQLLVVLHSLLRGFWAMTRRVSVSAHVSLSNHIRRAWSCAANLFVHFITAGGFVVQPLIVTSDSSRSLFVLLNAAYCYGLNCHSALCRLLFLSLSSEPDLLLAMFNSDSTLVSETIQTSDHSKVLGWLFVHMSHCPVGQSRDCLFVLVFKIVIAQINAGQEPLDVSKTNALLLVLLKFRLSSVLHVFSGHFPTDYSESICRWLFKALRSNPVDNFDKRSAIDFFCTVERVARFPVDLQSSSCWPASLFDLPDEKLAFELHALSVSELRFAENYLCQLWFHNCTDSCIPSRESRPFSIIKTLCSLRHHMACAFLVSSLLKYSVSCAIFRCSRKSTVEHGMSCSFELINNTFLELFVPSDSASPHCYDAVLSGVLDLISKLVMVHSVEVESAPLPLHSPLPALFLEQKLQVTFVCDVSFCMSSFHFCSSVMADSSISASATSSTHLASALRGHSPRYGLLS